MREWKDIICIATRRIDDDLPTNCQQLMRRLAMRHKLLYVEPAIDTLFLIRNPKFAQREERLPGQYPSNLYPIRPHVLPFEQRFPLPLRFLNRRAVLTAIRKAMKAFAVRADILWLFRPQDEWIIEELSPEHVCYHVTDKYNTMAVNIGPDKDVSAFDALESRALQRADIVFCTAASLHKELSATHDQVVLVRNVADVSHFAQACKPETPIPDDIAHLPHPIIGFWGAINSFKIDYGLIEASSKGVADGSVVMIGPVGKHGYAEEKEPPKRGNIHYLGTRSYRYLPGYLKGFDVCLIPYRDSSYTRHVFPMKFFEYLSAGKPVVSTPLPSLSGFQDLVYFAAAPAAWQEAIQQAVSEDDAQKREARKALASENSWEVRVSEIEACLRGLKKKTVDIQTKLT